MTVFRWMPAVVCLSMAGVLFSPSLTAQEDEPVGWPLKKQPEQEASPPVEPAPSPQEETAAEESSGTYEVAPLEIFHPPIQPLSFIYPRPYLAFTTEEGEVLKKLALRLMGTGDRILITSYAGDGGEPGNDAVRRSFRRALIVRGFLIEEGVSPDQINLEALGAAADDGPAERVEITPIPR